MRVIWGDRSSERTVMPTGATVPPETLQDAGQREWLSSRWQFEDERYERQVLHADFASVLDRVGNIDSPVLRIYGVERLVEMAQRRLPGGSLLITPDGLPFFIPSIRVLSALLVLETQPEVRHAARVTLNALIEFSRQGEQTLLYALIPALADANRTCLRSLCETLGRYLAKYGGEETTLPPLAPLLRLTNTPEVTLRCLSALAETVECRAVRDQQSAMRAAQAKFGEPSAAPNNHLLENLGTESARLIEIRDLICGALRELHAPPLGIDSSEPEFAHWRSVRRLNLQGVFLAGGRLSGLAIPGAILSQCHLEGANLEGANLIACDLKGAHLAGAELYGTLLEGDPLPNAALSEANWWHASPASWHGTGGEALRRWLNQEYPAPAAPLRLENPAPAPIPVKETNPLLPPRPAPVAPAPEELRPIPPVQSAAQKIAELKRKAQKKSGAEEAPAPPPPAAARPPRAVDMGPRTDPRRRENPVPATVKDSGRGALPFTPGKVVLRDKALPNDTDILSESDLMQVTDLMTEGTAPSERSEKNRRTSQLSEDDGLTDEDLLAIEDLMRKPKGA